MERQTQPDKKLDIPIRRFITKRLIGVNKDSTIQESAARMVEFRISSLGILDEGKVIGIVTDTDFKKRALAEGRSPKDSVLEIMTPDPVTADVSSSVRDVLEMMSREKIKHVIVTDQGKAIGVTTLNELEDLDLQSLETYIAR
ncbi:MAG TPA: CBS domain-containing protein [Balneolaceae bacterium]|nr:CBS domain-containing protein [Balneolaceae bacterium]